MTTKVQAALEGLFPEVLGIRILSTEPDRVRGELEVRDDLCTIPGRMHGGALMAFADTLGAIGAVLNLTPGDGTTTLESKTNFFASAAPGMILTGESTPLHVGRRSMVWQTRITRDDDRLVALVTQTQMVLARTKPPQEQLSDLFQGLEVPEQQALLATLERAGGGLYEAWAEAETDPGVQSRLREAATREIENAETLEKLSKND